MRRPRILSGVQPTGALHLGNWLGAIRNWVALQESHETFVCVVDLHAITASYDPTKLAASTLTTAALYLACGINPEQSTVFVQSHVHQHSELCWLLNCATPLTWLERMIQFKEKSVKQSDNISVGLLDYPVLMAADILLYGAERVPVGEDQKQHLELARDIAQQRINARFGSKDNPVLNVPEALILPEGGRIMSLTDGNSKMSKSDPNSGSRITLLDTPEQISHKIKRAKTDLQMGLTFGDPGRPEADNLLGLYALLSGKRREAVAVECAEMGWGRFKLLLTEATISALAPIQAHYRDLMQDKVELGRVLSQGHNRASTAAEETIQRLRGALGLLPKSPS